MKYLSTFLLTCLFVCLAFSPPKGSDLNGEWILIAYTDLESGKVEKRSIDYKPAIEMYFRDDGVKGKITGTTIPNKVYGRYRLSENNRMQVIDFGGTKMGEIDPWGKRFWAVIKTTHSYQIKKDELTIYYADSSKSMTFAKSLD